MFIASDDIASWTSENYYKVIDDEESSTDEEDNDCYCGFSEKIRVALQLDNDVAMSSYTDEYEETNKNQG